MKWQSVLVSEMMSSDENDHEDGNTLFKKALPWRSSKVTKFFDKASDGSKSAQSARQSKCCTFIGDESERRAPDSLSELPSRAFATNASI